MFITPLTLKDGAQAALLHQAAFYKGWTEEDFQAFLNDPLVFGLKILPHNCHAGTCPRVGGDYSASHEIPKQVRDDSLGKELCGYILWREIESEAEILTLVIALPFQRLRLGHLLLKALLRHLEAQAISKLFLEVAEDNIVAQSFYLKHGFTLLGTRPNYYKRPGNEFVDALNFVKLIEEKPFPCNSHKDGRNTRS